MMDLFLIKEDTMVDVEKEMMKEIMAGDCEKKSVNKILL